MRQWKLPLIVVLSLLLLLFAITPACSQAPATTEEQPASQRPAEFEVGPITFEPATVMAGDPVTVTTTVKNIGDIVGTYTATFTIDGQEMGKKDITVEPRNNKEASFQFSKTNPGTYNLTIGNSSATMTACSWSPYTIQYNEEEFVHLGIYVGGENGHIVRFTPPTKPFRIQKIGIGAHVVIMFNSDYDKNHCTVRIWDKDGNNQLWSQDIPWRSFGGVIEVPDILVNDDFQVEVVTHSTPSGFVPGTEIPKLSGAPIGMMDLWATNLPTKGGIRLSPLRVVLILFDYPKSYTASPTNRTETRSGYSYMGKRIDPEKGRSFTEINWIIRVEGEGAPSN